MAEIDDTTMTTGTVEQGCMNMILELGLGEHRECLDTSNQDSQHAHNEIIESSAIEVPVPLSVQAEKADFEHNTGHSSICVTLHQDPPVGSTLYYTDKSSSPVCLESARYSVESKVFREDCDDMILPQTSYGYNTHFDQASFIIMKSQKIIFLADMKRLLENIVNMFDDFLERYVQGKVMGLYEFMLRSRKIENDFIKDVLGSLFTRWIKDVLRSPFSRIKDVLRSLFSWIEEVLRSLFSRIKDDLRSLFSFTGSSGIDSKDNLEIIRFWWMNPLISHFREIKILLSVDAKCGRDKRGGAFKETSESVSVTPVKTANCEQKEKTVVVVAEKVVSIETLALCACSVLDEGRSREDMRTVEISTQNDQPFEFQIPFSAEDVGERRLVIWKKGAAPLGHDLKSLCHLGHKAPIEKDFLRDVLSIPDCIKPPLQIVQVYNVFVQRGYEAEWKRLASFKDCPEENWYPAIPLADQGFHFKPHSSVVCFFCKSELHTWERDWDPKQKHEPSCPLPNGRDCGNIPMKPSRDNGKYQPAVQAVYNELQIQELQDKNQVLLRNSKRSLESFKNPQLPEYQMEYLSINVNQGQGQQGHDAMEDEPQPSTSSQQQQEGAGGLRYFVHSYDEHGRPISTSQKMEFNSQEEKANTSMKRETDRLKTFDNVWKKGDVILPKELAKSGFYYAGTGDRARCAFCNGVLRNWAVGDRAPAEHRRHYPTCPFVLNLDVGNIPSSPDLSGLHTSTAATTNHTEPNRPAARTPGQQSARSSVANVGATTTPSAVPGTILVPKHSNFRTVETRLLTYNNWPTSNVQRPKELAEAGFFYTGTSDNVRCFHCDGGLRNWLDSDLPWVEHAKWFPRCGYLQRVKGVEFVLEEMRKHNQQNFTTAVAENRGSTGLMTTPAPTPGVGIVERPSTSGVRRVEAREVRARFDTDRVKMVLDMGYKEAVVKYVILQRLRYTGDDFPNTQEMLESVLAEEPNLEEKGIAYYENILQTEFGRPMTIVYPQITQTPSQAPPMTQSTSAYLPIPGDEKTLVEENRQLKEQTMCKICMDNEVSMVFIPCGHLVACADCAPSLSQCPICRRAITGTIRTFLS